jgi:hypothetical protein
LELAMKNAGRENALLVDLAVPTSRAKSETVFHPKAPRHKACSVRGGG